MAAAPIAAQAQLSYPAEKWWDSRWYIAPFGSYTLADNDRRADDGWGGGISIGKAISPSWDLELRGSYEQLDANGAPSDWKNYTLGIDAKWYFLGREGLERWKNPQFYTLVGVGGIRDKVGGRDEWSAMASAGLGVAWPLASWGRIFLDGRYRWDNNRDDLVSGSSFNSWVFNLGLQIPLGAAPAVTQPVRAAPPPPPPPAATTAATTAATAAATTTADDETVQHLG